MRRHAESRSSGREPRVRPCTALVALASGDLRCRRRAGDPAIRAERRDGDATGIPQRICQTAVASAVLANASAAVDKPLAADIKSAARLIGAGPTAVFFPGPTFCGELAQCTTAGGAEMAGLSTAPAVGMAYLSVAFGSGATVTAVTDMHRSTWELLRRGQQRLYATS